jgi:DNA polymerase I-like protein with 3'-5' exonuclease and polymerase domains
MIFRPQTEWVPPEEFPDLSKHEIIAIDLETCDPNLIKRGSGSVVGDGYVVGIAVAVEGWRGYFPIAHEAGGNMDKQLVLKWFKDVLATPATKVFHNAMYDVCWIRSLGLTINGRIVDTMIAASLVDENRFSYTLDSLGKEYTGIGKNESELKQAAKEWQIDAKAEMWRLPAMNVGDYAERDVLVTLKLWERMQVEMGKQDLNKIFDIETRLFPCLVDMKFKGVRVDVEKAQETRKNLLEQEGKILNKIKGLCGLEVEIHAARSIAKAFDKLNIPYDKTDKGNPSFTKNFLATHPHEIAKLINEAREINKANSTFIETILKYEHKGRIHADINQIRSDSGGTVTGRFSYYNPNLQQIPARNPVLGPMIRSIFIPEEGCKWGCFDYSQQEPRLLVHYASLQKLDGVSGIVDAYRKGNADFHQAVADMADIERKQAKTINLGIMYGMGKNKLMAELGLLQDSAEKLLNQYHQRAPFVKQLMQAVSRRAEDLGRIRTYGGRLCHFDFWEPYEFGLKALPREKAILEYGPGIKRAGTYKALNRLIQGSAADMTKISMVALYENGFLPHIQVHDELDISVENDQQATEIIKIMEEAIALEVPNKVDYESGKNWGDIK